MATSWVGIGKGEVEFLGPGAGTRQADVGVNVDADTMTIEPSGALTFWSREGHSRSRLIMAFAPGNWTKCHLVEGTPVDDES
jgi:hypothetical protein